MTDVSPTTGRLVACALRATVEHFSHARGQIVALRRMPRLDTALLESQRRTMDEWIGDAIVEATRAGRASRHVSVTSVVTVRIVTGQIVLMPMLGTSWLSNAVQSVMTMFGGMRPKERYVEPFVVADVLVDFEAERHDLDDVLSTVRTALEKEGHVVRFESTTRETDGVEGPFENVSLRTSSPV